MLKAQKITALRIALSDGVNAVLLPEGDDWNGMRKYRCVAPEAFRRQVVIVAPLQDASGLQRIFDDIFGRIEEMTIVMASPGLGQAIRAINAAMTQAAA